MSDTTLQITLIHALAHSMPAIDVAFERHWQAPARRNILDDSLSKDVAREGGLTPSIHRRVLDLARYAAACGTDAILFTCSAFGPCIQTCIEALNPLPILKPNDAMIEQAISHGKKIGLLATFPPTLQTMPHEFPSHITVEPKLAEGALAALSTGDAIRHDKLIADAATMLTDCDVIALSQFSMARAAARVQSETGKQVFTTPDCAVLKLRKLLCG